MEEAGIITGTDFVGVPTTDLARSVTFYRDILGLHCSVHMPENNFAEFETGNLTLSVIDPVKMGIGEFTPNRSSIALHVEDITQARETLEERGLTFFGDTLDTGVCHMGFFEDPDGNAFMLHHRYTPRVTT